MFYTANIAFEEFLPDSKGSFVSVYPKPPAHPRFLRTLVRVIAYCSFGDSYL